MDELNVFTTVDQLELDRYHTVLKYNMVAKTIKKMN